MLGNVFFLFELYFITDLTLDVINTIRRSKAITLIFKFDTYVSSKEEAIGSANESKISLLL